MLCFFFFSSRRRHTRLTCDWSSDVCSSDLPTCSFRRVGALDRRAGELFVDSELRLLQRRRIAVGRDDLVVDQGELLTRSRSLTLPIPHAGIEAALCQELVMAAALDDGS